MFEMLVSYSTVAKHISIGVGGKDGIGPCWFSPNPTRTRRSKPEPDPNPRPHKEARFGPTVVFRVH